MVTVQSYVSSNSSNSRTVEKVGFSCSDSYFRKRIFTWLSVPVKTIENRFYFKSVVVNSLLQSIFSWENGPSTFALAHPKFHFLRTPLFGHLHLLTIDPPETLKLTVPSCSKKFQTLLDCFRLEELEKAACWSSSEMGTINCPCMCGCEWVYVCVCLSMSPYDELATCSGCNLLSPHDSWIGSSISPRP